MDIALLVRSVVIGFLIAAPVGPIGVLVIRRTLTDGRVAGLVTGLGAATADALYGAIAAFGLTIVSSVVLSQQFWIRLVGGLFLCYLGTRTLAAHPGARAARAAGRTLLQAYTATLILTLTNPVTILAFAAIFAGLGVTMTPNSSSAAAMTVLGVFVGSTLWWVVLTGAAALLRARLTPAIMHGVNRVSGVIILGFGLVALVSLR
jgi:threonine/homoserine/homoserine lactone efflux protein